MNTEVLLAGSIGALSVFLLGLLRESLQQWRELRGLTRLATNEIMHNTVILQTVYGDPAEVLTDRTGQLKTLRVDTWVSVRVRLAEMMPAADFWNLSFYYALLQELERIQQIDMSRIQAQRSSHPEKVEAAIKSLEDIAAHVLEKLEEVEQRAYATALAYTDLKWGLLGWYWLDREVPRLPGSTQTAGKYPESILTILEMTRRN